MECKSGDIGLVLKETGLTSKDMKMVSFTKQQGYLSGWVKGYQYLLKLTLKKYKNHNIEFTIAQAIYNFKIMNFSKNH